MKLIYFIVIRYGTKVYDFMSNAPEGTITGCRWWVAPSATGILLLIF